MTLKENLERLEGYLKLLDREMEQAGNDAEIQEAALLKACGVKYPCDIDDLELYRQACNLDSIKYELQDARELAKEVKNKIAKAAGEAFYL